jgi:DNA-binding XRE family transcriptional regulator
MEHQTITRKGKRYILIEEADARRLGLVRDGGGAVEETSLPPLPKADKDGNRPAIAFARASIARQIIRDRMALGLSQAELARRAGIRVETLNRLEKARRIPDQRTFNRIDAALKETESLKRHGVTYKAKTTGIARKAK